MSSLKLITGRCAATIPSETLSRFLLPSQLFATLRKGFLEKKIIYFPLGGVTTLVVKTKPAEQVN
jgi:hypothetical protein